MRRFKGKWSLQNHWSPDKASKNKNQIWLKEIWDDQMIEKLSDGYDAFTICIPIKAYGPQYVNPEDYLKELNELRDELSSYEKEPFRLSRPPQGWDMVGEGDKMRMIPSARKEVGKFFRTQYPMFVMPTAQTVHGTYHREGGRYFNIAPLKQEGKNSPGLSFYAEECGGR